MIGKHSRLASSLILVPVQSCGHRRVDIVGTGAHESDIADIAIAAPLGMDLTALPQEFRQAQRGSGRSVLHAFHRSRFSSDRQPDVG